MGEVGEGEGRMVEREESLDRSDRWDIGAGRSEKKTPPNAHCQRRPSALNLKRRIFKKPSPCFQTISTVTLEPTKLPMYSHSNRIPAVGSKVQRGRGRRAVHHPVRHVPTAYLLAHLTPPGPSRLRMDQLYIVTFSQPPQRYDHGCCSTRCWVIIPCFCRSYVLPISL